MWMFITMSRRLRARAHAVRYKTVTGTCSRAHTRAADIWKCRESPWQQSVIKSYFLWWQIKNGICRNIRHLMRANTGRWLPNTSILHVHIFRDWFFPSYWRLQIKPKTKRKFHSLCGLRPVRVRGRASSQWGRNLVIYEMGKEVLKQHKLN